jgi:hypothetical protein
MWGTYAAVWLLTAETFSSTTVDRRAEIARGVLWWYRGHCRELTTRFWSVKKVRVLVERGGKAVGPFDIYGKRWTDAGNTEVSFAKPGRTGTNQGAELLGCFVLVRQSTAALTGRTAGGFVVI